MERSSPRPASPENQQDQITDENGKKPEPGDLIEIFRNGFAHWAIYIGGGNVVHFLKDRCGVVMEEKLRKVVAGDKWRINNDLDKKYEPKPISSIIKEACKYVEEKLPYDLLSYNCEHFVKQLRYGKAESSQVEAATTFAEDAAVGLSVSAAASVGPRLMDVFLGSVSSSKK